MYPDLTELLRERLDPDPQVSPAPGDRLAAVLLPLVMGPDPTLVFTVRSEGLNRHPGEVSFPGGMSEALDPNLRATALREAEEEIGLDPASVEVIGALPAVHTVVSGILVVPFVGILREAPTLILDAGEIASAFVASLTGLASAERRMERERPDGGTWVGWAYDVEGGRIWGATGQMLHSLVAAASEWVSR